jgi:hypothetical protein
MRTGLIAAIARTQDAHLRAELPLAGRSVLDTQVDLLRALGAERIICLCEAPFAEVLRVQQDVEAGGGTFHAIKGFLSLPALVHAEDDLIILRDGLVPDPEIVTAWLGPNGALPRLIAALPADHALSVTHPEDFERIDAARHWAGLLVMRGAAVQQLADFPADADAVSVLLRLALQAGTPCRMLGGNDLTADRWMLADSSSALARHEAALVTSAAPAFVWRAPMVSVAGVLVRLMAPRGLVRGAQISAVTGLALLLGGAVLAALALPTAGLLCAALGAFGVQVAQAFSRLSDRLRRRVGERPWHAGLAVATDGLAALALWFALVPWPGWEPLAMLGPLVIGQARLAERGGDHGLAAAASDRTGLLLVLALASGLGFLPETAAALALLVLGLLLRTGRN